MTKKSTPDAAPLAPDWLDLAAAGEWGRVVAALPGRNWSPADLSLLAAYCQHFSRWKAAEEVLSHEGVEVVLRGDKGVVRSVQVSPHFSVSQRSFAAMLKAGSTLGLFGADGAGLPGGVGAGVARSSASRAWFGEEVQ
jgi:P27 family predicted phage terminase small subunit